MRAWIESNAARGILSCKPAHAARRNARRPRGSRSSRAAARRRKARICERVSSGLVVIYAMPCLSGQNVGLSCQYDFTLSIFILPKTDSTFIYSSPKSLRLIDYLAIHTPQRLPHPGPVAEGRAQLLAIFAYNTTCLSKVSPSDYLRMRRCFQVENPNHSLDVRPCQLIEFLQVIRVRLLHDET